MVYWSKYTQYVNHINNSIDSKNEIFKKYGFLSFTKGFDDKYGKKLADGATNTVRNRCCEDCI